MGLTREYLRYTAGGKFNIIASSQCNVVFVSFEGSQGRYIAAGACEDVIIWDLRLLEKTLVLNGEKFEATRLCPSPVKKYLAVGYADGAINVFDLTNPEKPVSYIGHKSAITCLSYDWNGHRLASGSKDTDVIVWDAISECGLHRLNGHRGVVTQVAFHGPEHPSLLISSSKDTFVKFWDLDTQHCFKTLVGHRAEVWDIAVVKEGKYLITGSGDSELRVWSLSFVDNDLSQNEKSEPREFDKNFLEEDSDSAALYPLRCHKAGSILRNGLGRVISLTVDSSGFLLGCHGADTKVEIFQFRKELDATLKAKKRLRKERKKAMKVNDDGPQEVNDQDPIEVTLKDEVQRLPVLKTPMSDGKIKSIGLISGSGGELRVCTNSGNNVLSLYNICTLDLTFDTKKEDCYKTIGTITKLGHRSEVRTLCFSSDNLGILSASSEALKLWNRPSLSCLRTVTGEETKTSKASSLGYVLSACFVPGDRHAIVGMRDGRLLIADIGAGDILEEISAHSKEVWSICLTHDEKGCISGGGDSTVRFWSFELIEDKKQTAEDSGGTTAKGKVLSLFNTRALKLEETVLCICTTPNGRFLAVALLDSTVKIFFVDTLKFFLSLYGHKLPVACMDISSDSKLIATGGADRNVKIWGLDFGDCRRSLFAHDDSITSIKFVPKTHLFFTCGRDGRVKQWDGDSFQKIMTLPGHRGEAWALSVSPNGKFVVSAGSDHVLRLWAKTEELLVLEDQEEVEREEEAKEENLATGEGTVIPGQHGSNLPSRKTVGSEKAAEEIMEAMEIYEEYKSKLAAHGETCRVLTSQGKKDLPPPPVPPILMSAYKISCPNRFLIETVRRIRPSDIEEALLLLPFPWACRFLQAIPDLLKHSGPDAELICRTLLFLVRVHQAPIIGATHLYPLLTNITKLAFKHINQLRDVVGYNLHGLEFLQREFEIKEGVQLFREATLDKREKDKRKKRKEKAIKRAILTL